MTKEEIMQLKNGKFIIKAMLENPKAVDKEVFEYQKAVSTREHIERYGDVDVYVDPLPMDTEYLTEQKYSAKDLKLRILDCLWDVVFEYNGKKAGVTSKVHNCVPTFQMWYGESTKDFEEIDELMNFPFFDGKSLAEIAETLDISLL